jgi:RNA 3'-terminal phosphate cyclase (ATP)
LDGSIQVKILGIVKREQMQEMIKIDGSLKSGSGTILRDAIPFALLMGKDLHLTNIRSKRAKPGLRPQHLRVIEAVAQICEGTVKGAGVGSREIIFRPGNSIKGGVFHWDIGTAGSTTMLALSVIFPALHADAPSTFRITGGLFQDFAPSAHHVKYVLLPLLASMGIHIDLEIVQPGYVPKGHGQILVKVKPLNGRPKALSLVDQGKLTEINGIALSSHLKKRGVSDRMAVSCLKILKARGYDTKIDMTYDMEAAPEYQKASIQAGASLAVWARTDTGCLIGSDMAGALKRSAEFIGKQTARNLIEDLDTGATVDRFVADQLIPFAAISEGWTAYRIPRMSDHIEARLWLVEELLGAKTEVKDNLVRIRGIGYTK